MYSAFIAFLHLSSLRASSAFFGISVEYRDVVKAMVVWDKFSSLILCTRYLDCWASNYESYLFGGTPLVLLGGSSYLSGISILDIESISQSIIS